MTMPARSSMRAKPSVVIEIDVVFALVVTLTVVPALVRWLDREERAGR